MYRLVSLRDGRSVMICEVTSIQRYMCVIHISLWKQIGVNRVQDVLRPIPSRDHICHCESASKLPLQYVHTYMKALQCMQLSLLGHKHSNLPFPTDVVNMKLELLVSTHPLKNAVMYVW